ncbi:Transposase, partial [Cordylochernes scorpioides]
MVIGLKRAGWSIRQIAADTHLGASTVHRLWRRWLEQGNVAIYRNVGATRVTSARVDRRILRQAVAAPQATCTAILQHVQDTLDHSISTRTISRRLVDNGLHSCRPLRRLPLTPPNRRQRLEWCRARSTWMTEWHRVVFSDESRFCLSSDSRRVRVWRRRGERSNPAAIVERPTVRQRGIMVWGAIAYDSRSPLLRIQGTMTAQRYVDDVLRPVTLPYLQGVPNALYQQDNARPHTARISQQALQDVQMLPWPPYSPDLSPIEHVWDIIGRRLHALPQPRSEDELWQMVEREWRAIPQDAIRTLIDSLPRRVAACIAVRAPQVTNLSFIDSSMTIWRVRDSKIALLTKEPEIIPEIWLKGIPTEANVLWSGSWSMVNIFLGGHTALHIFRQGTLTGQRYRDEILAAYVMPQSLEMVETLFIMDDNAGPHRAGVVDTFLQNHAIDRMNWPARSPDLNPIEHVWDNLGRRISSLQPPPRNTHELETALTQEWALIPQELINSLIL